MKTILPYAVLFAVAFGWQQAQAQSGTSYEKWRASASKSKKTTKPAKAAATKTVEAAAPAAPKTLATPSGTFTGTLPCADCQGIAVELELLGGNNGAARTFRMQQTYLGKPADKNKVTYSGKWFLAKGNKQDPEAVVLQLIPTEGDAALLYFRQVSDSELKLLDRKQAEFQSKLNYSLKQQR